MIHINNSYESNRKKMSLGFVWAVTISFMSLLVGIIILFDTSKPEYYSLLPVLPISFGLINILSFKMYHKIEDNIVNIVVILMYLIRNVVTPFFMVLGGYKSIFTLLNDRNVSLAILLMIYETFLVLMYLAWGSNKNQSNTSYNNVGSIIYSRRRVAFFGISTVLIIGFCIYAYIAVPEIRASFASIFEQDKLVKYLGGSEQFIAGSINRLLYTLFYFFFNIVQIFISLYLIYFLRVKLGDKLSIALLSCGIAFVNFLFFTNETAYTLIVVAVLFIAILKLFKKNKVKILFSSGAVFGFVLMNLFYIKSNDMIYVSDSIFTNTSIMLQAYFPGVSNIAGVFNISNSSKLTTLFYDIYSVIPFRSSLFRISGDQRLVMLYTEQNLARANILPFIGQVYHYLGFVFSPLISLLFIKIARKYQNKIKNEKNIWMFSSYLLFVIFLCSSLIMYNPTIFGARFFITILPMMILANHSSNKYSFK